MSGEMTPTTSGPARPYVAAFDRGFRWHNTDIGETCHGPEWFVECVEAGRIILKGGPDGVDWTAAHVWTEAGPVLCAPGDWIFIDASGDLHVVPRERAPNASHAKGSEG